MAYFQSAMPPESIALEVYPKLISEDVIVLEVGASYGKGAKCLSKLAGFVHAIGLDNNSNLH